MTLRLRLNLFGPEKIVSGSGPSAPVNTVAPAVTGVGYTGQTMSTTDGTWTGSPTFTYQWQSNGVDIGGATSSTYDVITATEGTILRCAVTATNGGGSASANSNSIHNWIPSDNSVGNWYDATDASTISLSGSGVTQWDDKTGSGDNLSQPTFSSQPQSGTRTLNGLNVLDCDGFAYMQDNSHPMTTSFTVIIMTGNDGITNSLNSLFSFDAANDFQYQAGLGANFRGDLNTAGLGGSLTGSGTNNGPSIYIVRMNAADGSISTIIDGTVVSSASTYNGNISATQTFRVFEKRVIDASGIGRPDGFFGEMLIDATAVDTATRQEYEGYLAHKWGLTANLPGGHPYKTNAPTV